MAGTLQVPVSFISVRMLQGELKHRRRQVCPDFSDMITEWESTVQCCIKAYYKKVCNTSFSKQILIILQSTEANDRTLTAQAYIILTAV